MLEASLDIEQLRRELEVQTPFRANTPGKPSERDLREMEEAVAAYHFAVRRAAERGRRTSDAEGKENGARIDRFGHLMRTVPKALPGGSELCGNSAVGDGWGSSPVEPRPNLPRPFRGPGDSIRVSNHRASSKVAEGGAKIAHAPSLQSSACMCNPRALRCGIATIRSDRDNRQARMNRFDWPSARLIPHGTEMRLCQTGTPIFAPI